MNKIRQTVITIALTTAATSAATFTTNFSTLTDGNLSSQDGWIADRVDISGSAVQVSGFGQAVNNNAVDNAFLNGGIYTSTINFSYDITDNGNGPILNVGFFNTNNGGLIGSEGSRLSISLTRNSITPNNVYRLSAVTSWGNTFPTISGAANSFQQSGSTPESGLGLDFTTVTPSSTIDSSDNLQLIATLTAGADADSWSLNGVLRNVDTGSELLSYTVNDVTFVDAGEAIYGGFGGGQGNNNVSVQNRNISEFSFESVPEPSTGILALASGLLLLGQRKR